MRILKTDKFKWELKYLIAIGITVILAIISGIVLYKISNISSYIFNFANSYVCFVFNFDNGALFFSHLLSNLFYLYIIFLLSYFTKVKFLSFLLLFIKSFFTVFYCIVLFVLFSIEGIVVALLVFIPCYIVWLCCFAVVFLQCRCFGSPFVFFLPAVLSLADSIIMLLLVNFVFRVIVVIA